MQKFLAEGCTIIKRIKLINGTNWKLLKLKKKKKIIMLTSTIQTSFNFLGIDLPKRLDYSQQIQTK